MIETDSAAAAAAAFRNVTFRYPGEQLTLIENLDFTIRRGEFVSLVGPSGCGKSTIFRLLNRLNEPLEGTVETFAKDTEDPGKGGSAKITEENRESSLIGLEKNRESSPAEQIRRKREKRKCTLWVYAPAGYAVSLENGGGKCPSASGTEGRHAGSGDE